MVKKRINKQIEKKIILFADKLSQEGIRFNSLILFGSHAKGLAKPYSDIDLCVVSPYFGKDEISEAAKLRLLAYDIDWRIEPHPISTKDLKIRANPFVYEILTYGIEIKSAN